MVAHRDENKSDLREALARHLQNYPNSPIRAVIDSTDIRDRLARFEEADVAAIRGQKSRLGIGKAGLWATMLGTVIGASALIPVYDYVADWAQWLIQGVQALALVFGVFAATICPSPYRWVLARASAEAARADLFRSIIRAGAAVKDLLGPALDCFNDAHTDWQLEYYRDRIAQIQRNLVWLALYRWTAYLLRGLVVLFAAAIFVKLFWPELRVVAQWFDVEEPERWQLGFGVMATALVAFTTARSYMDPSVQSAERFREAADAVEALKREGLRHAKDAASAGNVTEVLAFCEAVQSVLSNEQLRWTYGAESKAA
jgi:hypothetical protein